MPAVSSSDKKEQCLKVSMVVFVLDNLLDAAQPKTVECLCSALEVTKFGQFADSVPVETACAKAALQTLASLTAFPRSKVESVLGKFNEVFVQRELDRLQIPNLDQLRQTLSQFKSEGYSVVCATYHCFKVALAILNQLDLSSQFDMIIGADNVHRPPPSPELAYKLCLHDGLSPSQVVFVDTMEPGKLCAARAGCHVFSKGHSYAQVSEFIADVNETLRLNPIVTTWKRRTTVLFHLDQYPDPFASFGYGYPAALVDLQGSPMCQAILKNLNMDIANLVFMVRKSQYEKYNMRFFLESLVGKKNASIVTYDFDGEPSDFRLCETLLQAEPHLPANQPLVVVTCSQMLEWDSNAFLYSMANPCVDGGVLTFNSTHPRYGFVATDEHGWINQCVTEKPISTNASAGIFYWKSAETFVKYSRAVVEAGEDGNGKTACLRAYQKAILDGQKIRQFACHRVWEISSRKDLETFLQVV